jgi:putative CocE/NonD family hydrolase
MRRRDFCVGAAATGALSLSAISARALAADAAVPEVDVSRDVPVRMRDGVVLRADVYRPRVAGALPALVQRTPYNKAVYDAHARQYAAHGYLVVMQDVRGQFASQGTFDPWIHEGTDGYDTIEWAARLTGCDGKVGMMGTSYQAAAQWQAARLRPPHLAAMVPAVSPADYYDQWVFPSGAFALSFNESWLLNNVAQTAARRLPDGAAIAARMAQAYTELTSTWYRTLPLNRFAPLLPDDRRIAPYFFDWINRHSARDAYWDRLSLRGDYSKIAVPALIFDGWYDVFLAGGIENHLSMRAHGGSWQARAGTTLVIGPYAHNGWGRTLGEMDYGAAAVDTSTQVTLDFFDWWLKGLRTPAASKPAVTYFSMGVNTWRTAASWPPPRARAATYYLHGKGSANGLGGDGTLSRVRPRAESPDRFAYDPNDPVPSVGGNGCCYVAQSPMGPYDQRAVERRPDVLVYTTDPLPRDTDVTGPIRVDLYASSSAVDTDFTAKLVDVWPDGRAINISGGIVRASHRHSDRTPRPIKPNTCYQFRIDLSPTSNVFLAGHRIRLEISSSDFPRYDRNPNTGAAFGQSAAVLTAHQTVWHDAARPSSVTLSILD